MVNTKDPDKDLYEVLMDHDEMSEDESVGDLEGSDPDPDAIEDEDYDFDDLINDEDDDEDQD